MALLDNQKSYNMGLKMNVGCSGKLSVAGLDSPPQRLILSSAWLSGDGSGTA
jgi:hypothetical protein